MSLRLKRHEFLANTELQANKLQHSLAVLTFKFTCKTKYTRNS